MNIPALPTFDQVAALPARIEAGVRDDFIDENGHMNIRHYLEFGARGAGQLCEEVGIDDAYRLERRMGLFTAEHHLRYFSELHEGERLSVHTRVLGRTSQALHMMAFLLDRTHHRLANTLEVVIVHVDLDTRGATPLPDDIASGFDQHIADGGRLDWAAPLCGAMGLRIPSKA
ncbi:thioesterase family protein [Streptomyces sp. NPDC055092]